MFIRNGQEFDISIPHLINDNQYPAIWFADPDQRASLDIFEVPNPIPPEISSIQIAILQGFTLVDGIWQPNWLVRDLTEQELAAIVIALAEAKVAKELQIRHSRDLANSSEFPYAGKYIAIADIDMRDILVTAGYIALFGALHPEGPGGWICTDKSFIPITTVDDFKALYSAMYDQGAANFAHSRVLLASLTAATNLAQVAAINW